MNSQPPYTITLTAADYLAKIVESVVRLELGSEFKRDLKLHKENRIMSIQSSLAIEGNPLSVDEVTAVIEGKLDTGKKTEIKEVKNAYNAYEKIMKFDPFAVDDFLKAHKLMTNGLIKESGKFRSGDVGVYDGAKVIHMGERPRFVPQLIEKLFAWAKETELHPAIKSAVLHYEIETIHPFGDGNGRMGRLWQTLTLAKWNELFEWIPMESVLFEKVSRYYQAIADARDANDSGVFIEFTLSAFLETLQEQEWFQFTHQVTLSEIHFRVLKTLNKKGSLSRKDIFAAIGMSGDTRSYNRNIAPLLNKGLVEMTIPDKPNSRIQKYRLTATGLKAIKDK
jgi:Fic family protein